MASVLKRGGVWYAKWTDATGKRCRQRIEASSKGPSEGASRRARGRGSPASQPRAARPQRPSAAA